MTLRALLLGVLLATAPTRAASSTMPVPDSTASAPVSLVRALGRISLTSSVLVEATSELPVGKGVHPHILLEGTLEHWDAHCSDSRAAEERETPPTGAGLGAWACDASARNWGNHPGNFQGDCGTHLRGG